MRNQHVDYSDNAPAVATAPECPARCIGWQRNRTLPDVTVVSSQRWSLGDGTPERTLHYRCPIVACTYCEAWARTQGPAQPVPSRI